MYILRPKLFESLQDTLDSLINEITYFQECFVERIDLYTANDSMKYRIHLLSLTSGSFLIKQDEKYTYFRDKI